MKTLSAVFTVIALLEITLLLHGQDENAEPKSDTEVVELLKKASSYLEEDEKQRKESINRLVEIGAPAVPYLCTRLTTDNVMERIALVYALTRIGEPAVEELHKLTTTEDEKTRRRVIHILGKIGSEKSLAVFKQALEDADWAIRSNAATGLGKIKSEDSRSILFTLLKDRDDNVRLKALLSLADVADDEIIQRLVDMLDDPSYMVRFGAAEVIADYGEPSVSMLDKKLKDTNKPIITMLIIETLGNTKSESAAQIIKDYIHREEPLLRAYAAAAYSKTAPTSELETLRQMLQSEKMPMTRRAIEKAIETMKKR